MLLKRLSGLETGSIRVIDGNEEWSFGIKEDTLRATVKVHGSEFYSALAFRGSLGAAEAYMQGLWSSDDLVALMRIMVRNLHVLKGMDSGLALLLR